MAEFPELGTMSQLNINGEISQEHQQMISGQLPLSANNILSMSNMMLNNQVVAQTPSSPLNSANHDVNSSYKRKLCTFWMEGASAFPHIVPIPRKVTWHSPVQQANLL